MDALGIVKIVAAGLTLVGGVGTAGAALYETVKEVKATDMPGKEESK